MVMSILHPLLFILLLISDSVNGVKYELIHRHDLHPKWGGGGAPLERLRQLAHSDTIRVRAISRKVRLKQGGMRRQVWENRYEPDCNNGSRAEHSSGELPMYSGADYGVGQYLVKFRVGSPAQKVVLIADTGSDLTWSNCRYKCRGARCGGSTQRRRRVFRADRSSSFRTLPCSSAICKTDLANLFSLTRCPSPLDPCSYDYR